MKNHCKTTATYSLSDDTLRLLQSDLHTNKGKRRNAFEHVYIIKKKTWSPTI